MDCYDPVFLEEDEELYDIAPVSLHRWDVNNSEDILPIIFHLGPLVLMNHILQGIVVQIESLLEIGELLLGRTFRVNPQHLIRADLVRKRLESLGNFLAGL